MSNPAKKKALIVKSFKDAGTGESFTADATPMIDAGAYVNYEAAGLVTAPTATAAKKPRATSKSAPRKAAARRTATKPADPAPPPPASPEPPAPSA